MRIAIDTRHMNDHFPGIGRYVYNLVLALQRLDHQSQLCLIANPSQQQSDNLQTLAKDAQTEIVFTAAKPFSFAEQIHLPRLLRQQRIDMFHAPYYVRPYVGVPCPVVLTLYDAIPSLFPREVSLKARVLFNTLTRLAQRNAKHILTISQSARNDLVQAYRIDPQRISVTPLAADARFSPKSAQEIAAVRARHRLPERYLITLSSNKPHKNLETLVDAYAIYRKQQADPLDLVIAGHWDARYPQARLRCDELGLRPHIHFLPNLAEFDAPALLSGAECFVFASRYEGFGLPPLEAMACGAPVICGRHSSLNEVVGQAGLFADINQPAALAAQLGALLNDAILQKTLRQASLEQAKCFSWERTAELTLACYRSALD